MVGGLGAYLVWAPSRDGGSATGPGNAGRGADAGHNVLLITLDTTRADRLGCYGHEAAETPTMDGLAESGVRFEHAFCQVPLTLPSHTSLLTGLCPPRNGVRINTAAGLAGEVETMAEVFKRHGYRTGAFIGAAVLDSAFGLSRGFDVYDDDIPRDADARSLETERRADRVCAVALAWLKERPGETFFAWVHLFDPHFPYAAPRGFADKFADPYDGEIAFVDAEIGELIGWLDGAGLRERTMIVLVGDHGEGLDEHEETTHGFFVYNTTMKVPLILSCPGLIHTPRTVDSPVGVVDLFPTVVDLMGWEVPEDLDGRSLASACRTGEAPALPVYGESEYPRLGFGWASLRSLTTDRWKYIDAPRPELYDWRADPGELSNLADKHPDIAKRIRGDLAELASEMEAKRHAAAPVMLDSETLERLAALGYVAGASQADELDARADRRDPKDMRQVFAGFTFALSLMADHDYEQAASVAERLVRKSPESSEMQDMLGRAYLELGRFAEAQGAFEASLAAVPDMPWRLYGLGEALRNQGRFQKAVDQFEQALAIVPGWELAHRGLGAAYYQLKQYAQAEFHCRRCVEHNPTSPRYLANLGAALIQVRKPAEAIPLLQASLRYNPTGTTAHMTLWRGLVALGRRAEAVRALKTAREALPDVPSLTCALTWLLATTPSTPSGDIADAIRWGQECREAGPNGARNLDASAAAYAAGGDFAKAVEAAREALTLANSQGRGTLAREIEARLRLYEAGRPYMEGVPRVP